MDQEAARTRELIILARNHMHSQFFFRQVGARQLKILRRLVFVLVYLIRTGVLVASLQFFDGIFRHIVVVFTWGIVVSCHGSSSSHSLRVKSCSAQG